MKYLAASSIITDDVYRIDGVFQKATLGGAGIFAIAGMKVYTDDCVIMSPAGRDFKEVYGPWFRANGLTMDYVLDDLYEKTHSNAMIHNADGSYAGFEHEIKKKEKVYGDLQNYYNPPVEKVEEYADADTAVYFLRTPDAAWWDKMLPAKANKGFRIMWEYGGAAMRIASTAQQLAAEALRVLELAAHCEMFSINYNEASRLFAEPDEDKLVEMFKAFPSPFVLFRCGDRGLYTVAGGKAYRIPVLLADDYVDQTGCGNCSTGAATVAWCEGYDPIMTGIMANVAAHYNVKQFGPYPAMTGEKQAEAMAWAESLRARYDEAEGRFR